MSRLKRYLAIKKKQILSKPVPVEAYEKMVFGQINYGSKTYFQQRFGQCHTVALDDFPHYDFIKNHLQNPLAEHEYGKYLQASWGHLCSQKEKKSSLQDRFNNFIELYQKTTTRIEQGKEPFVEPIELCQRPDGKLIVVNGNHRASVGRALNAPIKAYYYFTENYLKKITNVPHIFYGSARMGLPYQSIFDGDKELIRGRRTDTKERIDLIDKKDLHGQTVLELGSNIGANCFAAIQAGASATTGIDVPDLIGVALRLNCYFAFPCTFVSFDLNNELDAVEPADVMFCFSVYRHIENKQALINTILNKTKKILYFEGHGHTNLDNYEPLLNKDNFKAIDLIGYTCNGIHTEKKSRPLYRCEIAR